MTVIGPLSAGSLVLSVAGLVAAFRERSARLHKTRWWCLALTGALVCASVAGLTAPWVVVVSCVGFLISLQAVALAEYAEPETVSFEPDWWPGFERDFRRYARRDFDERSSR